MVYLFNFTFTAFDINLFFMRINDLLFFYCHCKQIKRMLDSSKRLDTEYYFNHKAFHVNLLYYPFRNDFPMNKQWIHLAYARTRNSND